MNRNCPDRFDETLLTGHLDGELTQADEQRVRIHLEDCAHCNANYEELRELREVTMTTRLNEPRDLQWDERPRGLFSNLSRGFGWLLFIVWAAGTTGFALWQVATEPGELAPKLIVFGGLSAIGLLFLSVLVDRLKAANTDRYREVQK